MENKKGKRESNPSQVSAVVDKLVQRVLDEADDSLGNDIRQVVESVAKENETNLDNIPAEVLAIILTMVVDRKRYPDCIALYGALAQTSSYFAGVMEQPAIWRALLLAYVRRSQSSKGIEASDIDDYMRTLFDHYKYVIHQHATRPELTETWRTWKRILEHFKRIDDRIIAGETPVMKRVPWDLDKNEKAALVSCPESPYTFIVRRGYLVAVSGFGRAKTWHQVCQPIHSTTTSAEVLKIIYENYNTLGYEFDNGPDFGILNYDPTGHVRAVAYPEKNGNSAYVNLLTLGARANEDSKEIYIHRIESPKEKDSNNEMALKFVMHAGIVKLPSYIEWVGNFAVSRRYLWVVASMRNPSQGNSLSSILLVYTYDTTTRLYSLMKTPHQSEYFQLPDPARHAVYGLLVHPFRSNVVTYPAILGGRGGIGVTVLTLLADGTLKTPRLQFAPPLDFWSSHTYYNNYGHSRRLSELEQSSNGDVFVTRSVALISELTDEPIGGVVHILRHNIDDIVSTASVVHGDEDQVVHTGSYIPIVSNGSDAQVTCVDSHWLIGCQSVDDQRLDGNSKLRVRFFNLETPNTWHVALRDLRTQECTSELILNYTRSLYRQAPYNRIVNLRLHFHNGTLTFARPNSLSVVSYGFDEWSADPATYLSSRPHNDEAFSNPLSDLF